MSLLSYIIPQKIAQFDSEYNDKVTIVESFGKPYIEVGGLMQSGSFLERVWSSGCKKLKLSELAVSEVLILGLGGGSFAEVINQLFPDAKITGVDIDSVIVDAGRKYLKLNQTKKLKVYIDDAFSQVKKLKDQKKKFDLIFVDLYCGYNLPEFVERENFLNILKNLLSPAGHVIFNRLYFRKYKIEADIFLDKLTEIFHDVKSSRSYSNLLILAN